MYEWIKALHIVAVIAWMAGQLYLPRLMVYHSVTEPGSEMSETFKVMERRLLRAIMTPAMVVTWAAGLYLMFAGGWLVSGWLHAKLMLVVLMSASHGFQAVWVRDFRNDLRKRPQRFYRFANEFPTLLLIGIVILVVVKPF